MSLLGAHVRNGRLLPDEPSSLPEGTDHELAVVDPGDDLDAAQLAKLHAAIERGAAELKSGRVIHADELLADLNQKR